MADTTAAAFAPRWYHRIPFFGLFARDLDRDFEGNIGYLILTVASLAGIGVLTWGLPALVIVALALVPVCFALIFLITWG